MGSAQQMELHGLLERWQTEAEALAAATAPAPEPPAAVAAPAPAAEPVAFYRRGDIWTIGTPGARIRLRHAKGLTHVARLLAAPRVEFHALDLVAGPRDHGTSVAVAVGSGIEVRARGDSDAGPVLDVQAKAAYRARLTELQEEIDEAESSTTPSVRRGRAASSASSRASSPARSASAAAIPRPARTPNAPACA